MSRTELAHAGRMRVSKSNSKYQVGDVGLIRWQPNKTRDRILLDWEAMLEALRTSDKPAFFALHQQAKRFFENLAEQLGKLPQIIPVNVAKAGRIQVTGPDGIHTLRELGDFYLVKYERGATCVIPDVIKLKMGRWQQYPYKD